jgi:hypothetical protein
MFREERNGKDEVGSRKPTLADLFEQIGERTAGDSTAEANARTQPLHHCAVEAMGDSVDAYVLCVRGLGGLVSWGMDVVAAGVK